MNYIRNWDGVKSNIVNRLSSWKSIFFYQILIKAVLGSILGYYLSIYKAPTKVIASLERLRRDFCWGSNYESHKIWWLAWNKMMAPKKVGGPWRNIIRNKTELEVMGIDIFRWVQRSFEYSVKLVRENIESRMLPMESHVFHDSKWVPSKVNIFVWKAVTD
ncbi:hypothetical protein QVD17_41695 [Tagetes erecta]|uniref:Reverse transcriptase zinc-binding domain-containing protein n=1 Tax=Tagetes erecta TaxID=13708 RepID=A0AAD8NFU4_TARER|nr:hypothetical protein QVD17_41695 [Tagetes erecta]